MPWVRVFTTWFLLPSIVGRSSSTPLTLTPCLAMPCPASSNRCEECSSALEGMQPTLRQVPPSAPRFSTQATLSPSWAALIAAT